MSDRLAVLARCERHALDEEKRALEEIAHALARLEERAGELRKQRERELCRPPGSPAEAGWLARFLDESRRRERALNEEMGQLEAKRSQQVLRLQARRVELKRLELLVERRAARAREAGERRERRDLDDLVLMRRARRGRQEPPA